MKLVETCILTTVEAVVHVSYIDTTRQIIF